MNMNAAKMSFVMSDEFVTLVRNEINEVGVMGVIRLTERRYQFRNPKLDGIVVTVEDIKRAIGMSYGIGVNSDRLVNIYTWVVSNVRSFLTGVKATKEAIREAWMSYRKYISENKLEKLFAGADVVGLNGSAEREFRMICSNVAEKI